MDIKKTIIKNISSLLGAQIITTLLKTILLIYIARTLGNEIFGKYSFIISLTAIFLMISDFGIKGVAIRDVARNTSYVSKYLKNIIILKLLFSLLSIFIFILVVTLLDMPQDTTQASYIFAGGLFFQSMSHAFRWTFHALQTMELEALQRMIEQVLMLILSVWLLWQGFGLIALSLVFLFTQISIFCLSAFFVIRKTKIHKIKLDLPFCKHIIKTAVFFALSEVLWMIYFRIDIIMLGKFKGEIEVGWYNAAYVVVNSIAFISMISMQAIFPVLSSLYKNNKNKLKETVERLFRYLLLLVLLIVPIIFIFSDEIINLIYGSGYSHSITALRILIFVLIFLFPGSLFIHTLASSNRHKKLTLINFTGVIVNILLNFILIPRFSYVGAGIATIITEIALCFLLYAALSKFVKIRGLKIILRILPGLAAMILVLYFAPNIPLIPRIIIALFVYSFFSYLTGSIKTEDFLWVSGILKKT